MGFDSWELDGQMVLVTSPNVHFKLEWVTFITSPSQDREELYGGTHTFLGWELVSTEPSLYILNPMFPTHFPSHTKKSPLFWVRVYILNPFTHFFMDDIDCVTMARWNLISPSPSPSPCRRMVECRYREGYQSGSPNRRRSKCVGCLHYKRISWTSL